MSGEIAVPRSYLYCQSCGFSDLPLDGALGIAGLPHRMTKRLMVEVAYYGQGQSSFGAASAMIGKALHMEISRETVREITESIGNGIFEADEMKAQRAIDNIAGIETPARLIKATLYIMPDGAAVNTRVEDENGSTWRENKTVMVFTDKDMINRKNGDHTITKKEYVPFIGPAEEFKKFVLDAAVRAGYGKVENVVVVADGAAWIRNMCAEIFPDAVQILDLYHLKENVYGYAKHLFKDDPAKYTPWAEGFIEMVETGRAEDALGMLPETAAKPPAGTVNLRTYIENNKDKIDYPAYRAKGFFVGSGAIESANKAIVQKRLKQAGMRWGVGGAQSVVTLRAKAESGLWEKEQAVFCA
jgi:hypothetical protein